MEPTDFCFYLDPNNLVTTITNTHAEKLNNMFVIKTEIRSS